MRLVQESFYFLRLLKIVSRLLVPWWPGWSKKSTQQQLRSIPDSTRASRVLSDHFSQRYSCPDSLCPPRATLGRWSTHTYPTSACIVHLALQAGLAPQSRWHTPVQNAPQQN
eukprot:3595989-Amphidinium_carterae.1